MAYTNYNGYSNNKYHYKKSNEPIDYKVLSRSSTDSYKIKQIKSLILSVEGNLYTDSEEENQVKLLKEKNFKINYRQQLNPQQYLGASTIEGPMLIIAGAGSGKTRVLVHRVAYMLELGINPSNILLLTFTNKAAKEMIHRASELLLKTEENKDLTFQSFMEDSTNIQGGTFHSFAMKVLRKYAKYLNITSTFKIIDQSDSEDIVGSIYREMDSTSEKVKGLRKDKIYSIISKSKNCSIPIEEVIEDEYKDLLSNTEDIKLVAEKYIEYKRSNNVLDYDDLLTCLRDKLRDYEEFRSALHNQYKYILVDEFQDTNIVQKEIIDYLASKHSNIMIVGDDSQSVYKFRGAEVENILLFTADYPKCKILKIEENYRSKQDILNVTNAIINNVEIGYKKKLFSVNNMPGKPIIKNTFSAKSEAEYIVREIKKLKMTGTEYKDIAVLFKASYHNMSLQGELINHKIPYVIYGGMRFLDKKHIKDIIAFLNTAYEPLDCISLSRVLRIIDGLGNATITKLINEANNNRTRVDISPYFKKPFYTELERILTLIQMLNSPNKLLVDKLDVLIKFYSPYLEKENADDHYFRMKDLIVLKNMALDYGYDVERFLDDIVLEPPNVSNSKQEIVKEKGDSLILSTIHSAKGLEWNTVFVMNMVENQFPSERALRSLSTLEEERRLFYVACTRAKSNLFLTVPNARQASRFINEIKDGADVNIL